MSAHDLIPLSPLLYLPLVHTALAEDLGAAGDITSDSIIPDTTMVRVTLASRQAGCLAGIDIAEAVFKQVDARLQVENLQGWRCASPRRRDCNYFRSRACGADRGTHGAQFSGPSFRDSIRHGPHGGGNWRPQGAHLLHP